MQRLMSDHRSACLQLRQIMPTFELYHIKECIRLGKYSNPLPHPRPLLVTLNSVSTVADILSNRSFLPASSTISIKPHLSHSKRVTESILLKERRALINENVSRNSIKLRGNHIFINEKLHARVLDGVLVRGHTLGDYSNELQGLSGDATQASPSSSTSTNRPPTASSTPPNWPPATSSKAPNND